MNTTTRRIGTTLAGLALAGSAVAATGPAAHAGKPGGGTSGSITVKDSGSSSNGSELYVDYTVPVASTAITSISCTLDGVPLTSCGQIAGAFKKSSQYWVALEQEAGSTAEHRFTVTATTSKATFTGAITVAYVPFAG